MRPISIKRLMIILALFSLLGLSAAWAGDEESTPGYPKYLPINPELVVNLTGPNRVQYLKVGIDLFVRTPEAATVVEDNMPLIRDRLLSFFSGRDIKEVNVLEERENLRLGALQKVQEALTKQAGVFAVEGLYFSEFIAQ